MQFESKIRRQYWVNCILGLTPDIFIAVIINLALGGYIWTFMLVLVILEALYFLVWLRKTIWAWIFFGVYGRKYLADLLSDYLIENNYPEPEVYERSAEEYFDRIATDESQPVTLRLKAAGQATALRMPITIGQYQYGFRVAMAYEDALITYKRRVAGRTRDKDGNRKTTAQHSEDRDSTNDEETLRSVNVDCEHHLKYVANFEDEYWTKADQERDIRGVLVAYFAAIDGTQDAGNEIFKIYEQMAKQSNRIDLFERIKFRKLKHLMQLRTYFEFKLKLQLLDQEGREKMGAQIQDILGPEVAEQLV
jgi:hypothetical protein